MVNFYKFVLLVFVFLLVGACAAGQISASANEANMEEISKEANEAIIDGDYDKAMKLALPYAESNDPEALFTVGMIMLEWLGDSAATSKPTFTAEDALAYVRKAADAGVTQAAGILRAGYQFGRYSLPEDEELAKCWRSVERGEKQAAECS
ncbi:MAG: hypothetical protein AAGA91_20610 [Pseudomonadota bacterium]